MRPQLPNLLIIGAQKCGTTSLHRYLRLHPQVSMSEPKELDFFVVPGRLFPVGNWSRGVDWYASHFTEDTPVRGESSPNYSVYPLAAGVPERASEVLHAAKIIYMVRDPIERIISHYLHRVGQGRERRSLDEALADVHVEESASTFVLRSMYFMQLERWTRCFPDDDVLVVGQEDLQADRAGTLQRVFRFLGVDHEFTDERFERLSNVSREKRSQTRLERWLRSGPVRPASRAVPERLRRSGARALRSFGRPLPQRRPVLSAQRRRELEDMLRDDAQRLRGYTGRSFSTWSV